MSSAHALVRGALVLGLTLGLGQLAGAQPKEVGWNQGRATAIAEALGAQYTLQEDIRLLKNSSRFLAKQLKAGKTREETRPIYDRMQQIRGSAEENARRTLIPESLMDQILAVGGQILQLQPYYREPDPEPAQEG
jgi:hypothetical protein